MTSLITKANNCLVIVSNCFLVDFYFCSSTVPEYFWIFSIDSLILDLLPTVDTDLMDTRPTRC